jgi:hypothetical protein
MTVYGTPPGELVVTPPATSQTFAFPYQNIDNVEVLGGVDPGNGLGMFPLAQKPAAETWGGTVWWAGDGQTITVTVGATNNNFTVLQLVCYE